MTGESAAVDITDRMSVFAGIFADEAGIDDPASLPDVAAVVEAIRTRVPRTGSAPETDAPIFEAAAFIGEWMRSRCAAVWVSEGTLEPHLQLVDDSHAIVVLLPLVSLMRTASTAGYDGIAQLLDALLQDVTHAAQEGDLEALRVVPESDRERVLAWLRLAAALQDGARAALWRRCATCATPQEEVVTLPTPGDSWESDAALAATLLARRPFRCPCGGIAGATTRFLMVTTAHGGPRFCDLLATPTHSRVASWVLASPTHVVPFDTTTLAPMGEA